MSYKKITKSHVLIIAVVAIAAWIILSSSVDYIAVQNQPLASNTQQSQVYGFWYNAEMLGVGVAIAAVLYVAYRQSKNKEGQTGKIFFWTVIIATIVLILSGIEDLSYFLGNGSHSLPANNTMWSWMYEYKITGFWDSTTQVLFTAIVLCALALFIYHQQKRVKEA